MVPTNIHYNLFICHGYLDLCCSLFISASDERGSTASRAQLREFVQRLHALPREDTELLLKYKDNNIIAAQLRASLNVEMKIIMKQAREIIYRMPTEVLPTEYLALAESFGRTGDVTSAQELTEAALGRLEETFEAGERIDVTDASHANRNLAIYAFRSNRFDQGRGYFQEAKAVFDKYGHGDLWLRTFDQLHTALYWAQQEAMIRECSNSEYQLNLATQHVTTMSVTDPALMGQIEESKRLIEDCNNGRQINFYSPTDILDPLDRPGSLLPLANPSREPLPSTQPGSR